MTADTTIKKATWNNAENVRFSTHHLFLASTMIIIFTTFTLPNTSALCTIGEFECDLTKKCIPNEFLCDGDKDCGGTDLSDEQNCASCSAHQFQCNITKQCIRWTYRCDGDNDCGDDDASDEEDCEFTSTENPCPSFAFRCESSNECIPLEMKCNGIGECDDLSDEMNCNLTTSCPEDKFLCENASRCISINYLCDGDNDCGDYSDEVNCTSEARTCIANQFQCNITKQCVDRSRKCDGEYDCGRGDISDERNCESCSSSQFHCNITRKCISLGYRCDGDEDCDDGDKSDEQNCESCSGSRFMCTINRRCIPASHRCDGAYDCEDLSDELNCGNVTIQSCPAHEFRCNATNKCITWRFKCDGDNDCGDWSDEVNCTRRAVVCSGRQFRCKNSTKCISIGYLCDGDNDCGDLSDEESCGYSTTDLDRPCEQNKFRCDNGFCLRRMHICNKRNDCVDNSDERGCISTEPCYDKEFRCSNGTCLHRSDICDGDADCLDGADEFHCTRETCSGFWCLSTSTCLSTSKLCNLEYDCDDKSDEHHCPAALKLFPSKERIIGNIGHTSRWTFNVTSNTNNWTIIWKNSHEEKIDYTEGKYKIEIVQKTQMLYEMMLEIWNVSWEDNGYYPLEVRVDGSDVESKVYYLHLTVKGNIKPELIHTNMLNSTLSVVAGNTLELVCNITNHPKSIISWSWDNNSLNKLSPKMKYKLYENNKVLVVGPVTKELEGRLMCKSESKSGIIVAYADVTVINVANLGAEIPCNSTVSLGILLVILGVVFVIVVMRYEYRQKKFQNLLNAFTKWEFSKRTTANNNGNLTESDEAHLVL